MVEIKNFLESSEYYKERLDTLKKRTLKNKLIALGRGIDFFDGERVNGYGGYVNNGSSDRLANLILDKYSLNTFSKVLQINCEKGYLLKSLSESNAKCKVYGTENSEYAISHNALKGSENLIKSNLVQIPFKDSYFDLVISFGNTYTLNLSDAILHLKELNRLSKNFTLISLATYYTEKDYWLMKKWSLLGNLILREEEWKLVLDFANYSGDFFYVSAQTLGLTSD